MLPMSPERSVTYVSERSEKRRSDLLFQFRLSSNQAFDVIEIVAILASGLIFHFAQVRRPCFQNVRLTVLQMLLQ